MRDNSKLVVLVCIFLSFSIFPVFQSTKAQTPVPAWDFEDHGYVHSTLTMQSADQINYELTTMDQMFVVHNLPTPQHIAYPNGSYSPQVTSIVSQHRLTGRLGNYGDDFPEPYPVPNWYTLSSRCIMANTTISQVKSWIDTAVKQKGLAVIYTHQVVDRPEDIGCTPAMLGQVLDYAIAQQTAGNLQVLTMRQAYTQFNGQKAVVVIAFDDGYATDYTTAYPMFKSRGIAGTSYIVGNAVNANDPKRLTWAMIAEMAQVSPTPRTDWLVAVSSYPTGGGTTSCIGQVTVPSGDLSVTAMPSPGYTFSYWLFDANRFNSNPLVIPAQIVGTTHILAAYFTSTSTPTPAPTPTPTATPTQQPTTTPSASPISSPTIKPSNSPPSPTKSSPTLTPSISTKPSATPSASPSPLPTQTAAAMPQSNSPFSTSIIIIAAIVSVIIAISAVGLMAFRHHNHSHKV